MRDIQRRIPMKIKQILKSQNNEVNKVKILDKLKNALFEEEYVEVEEKKDKKEKPIAKKIVLPEPRRERREEAVFEEDEVKEELPKEEKKTFKFPAISEDDFVDIREKTPTRVEEKPKPVERREVPQDFHPAYPPYWMQIQFYILLQKPWQSCWLEW